MEMEKNKMNYTEQSKECQNFLDKEATYLTKKSKEICQDNECTEEIHNCESYAYYDITTKNDIIIDLNRIDICGSDYIFKSCDIALPLPFEGNGEDLLDELIQYDDREGE
jgi:hypothetical protein